MTGGMGGGVINPRQLMCLTSREQMKGLLGLFMMHR